MDKKSKIYFYETRFDFLNNESEALEQRKAALLKDMEVAIAEFKKKMISISCNIASVEQLWKVVTKDTGVAEMKLKELKESADTDIKNIG